VLYGINDWLTTGESLDLGLNTWIPTDYVVCGAYPNPFNPTTTISYTLPEATRVSLIIHDLSGRVVSRLVDGWREKGVHEAVFDGSNLASGWQDDTNEVNLTVYKHKGRPNRRPSSFHRADSP